ncbi:MAG TPA: hypothetical protein PK919_02070 [Candidatus Aminicenantes bacterium]|nr:hypothetical protein [Candidatus Aminicenantes bacterium]
MAFTWPDFSVPEALAGQRSWTAAFDSYDQRNDNAYYVVTLREPGLEPRRFMAQIDVGWAGSDWETPGFVSGIRSRIAWVAGAGRTNTSYSGPL